MLSWLLIINVCKAVLYALSLYLYNAFIKSLKGWLGHLLKGKTKAQKVNEHVQGRTARPYLS